MKPQKEIRVIVAEVPEDTRSLNEVASIIAYKSSNAHDALLTIAKPKAYSWLEYAFLLSVANSYIWVPRLHLCYSYYRVNTL